MHRLTLNKFAQIKSLFTLLLNGTIILILGVDLTVLKRIMIDLTMKGLSLNQLQDHLRLIYCLKVSHHTIQNVQDEARIKAQTVNATLDKQVAMKITKVELDEVFQGKDTVTLGIVAKGSNYIMGLHKSVDRTKESLSAFLKPIGKRFANVTVVITDLFNGYKTLIPELFHKAVHLVCHLHAGRLLRRACRHLSSILSHRKKDFGQARKAGSNAAKKVQKKQCRIAFLTERLKKDTTTHTLLAHSQVLKKSKCTKTLSTKLNATADRIKKDKKEKKKIQQEVKTLKHSQSVALKTQTETEKKVKEAQQDLLQSSRLIREFRRLLNNLSPSFEAHKQTFLNRLAKSKYSLAGDILKMIHDNPDLFSIRNAKVLAWNFQNTNTIEGVFSGFRRLLDSTRLLTSDAGSERYCDLFRLYHNVMPPFTGPNSEQAPVERLGVKLHDKTYLDLLFPLHQRKSLFFCDKFWTQNSEASKFHYEQGSQCQVLS